MVPESLNNDAVERLQALYKSSSPAAKILDNFASRARDRRVVEVDRLEQILPDLARTEIIELFRKLDEFGFGQFLIGRRGAPSRFEWDVSLRSVGQAAAGQGTIVHTPQDLDDGVQPVHAIKHPYRLRADFIAQIELPADLTTREAERLAEFIKTLPFES
jgi:hypothetical protein